MPPLDMLGKLRRLAPSSARPKGPAMLADPRLRGPALPGTRDGATHLGSHSPYLARPRLTIV